MISVLLADDHHLVRAGIRALVETAPNLRVVGEAEDGPGLLRLVADLEPEVALVDVSMPGMNGIEATARLTMDHPSTRVIMISMHESRPYVERALRAGARGYLGKGSSLGELVQAIEAVVEGRVYLGAGLPPLGSDANGMRPEAGVSG